MPFDLLPYNPSTLPRTDNSGPVIAYPWFNHKTKATLFLPESMTQPKHGIIIKDGDSWLFHQSHTLQSKSKRRKQPTQIPLPTDVHDLEQLLKSKKLAKGWHNSKTIKQQISTAETFQIVARRVAFMHTTNPSLLTNEQVRNRIDNTPEPDIIGFTRKVSAKNLSSLYKPKLHEHHKLPPGDKEIWDKSYFEEYMGLHKETATWEYLTEDEYQTLRPIVGNALPSMAISKIKTNENGHPDRAKYRIVVLGNLDPHDWSNSDCFAPVISPFEVRLLVAIATQ